MRNFQKEEMLNALCRTQEVLSEERSEKVILFERKNEQRFSLSGMDAKFIEFVRTFVVLVREKRAKVDVVIKR